MNGREKKTILRRRQSERRRETGEARSFGVCGTAQSGLVGHRKRGFEPGDNTLGCVEVDKAGQQRQAEISISGTPGRMKLGESSAWFGMQVKSACDAVCWWRRSRQCKGEEAWGLGCWTPEPDPAWSGESRETLHAFRQTLRTDGAGDAAVSVWLSG